MKYNTKTLLCLMLLFSICASAAENEHKYRPMFFMNTFTDQDSSAIANFNSGYSDFADIIRSYGFRVGQDSEPNMTTEWLEENGVDVLLLPVPFSGLDSTEIQALRAFNKDGGTVVFLLSAGYDGAVHDHNNINSFTKPYGITLADSGFGGVRGNPVKGSPLWQPNGVSSVKVYGNHAQLAVDSRYARVGVRLEDDNILTAYSTRSGLLGSGQLIVHGDYMMFYRGPRPSTPLMKEDNSDFAKNFTLYAAGVFDLSLTKVKLKPKAPVTGKKATVVVQIKNNYHIDSAPVKLQVTLVAIGDSSAAETQVLATVTLPSIKVGKKKKQKIIVMLPEDLPAGDYFLSADIDPELLSPDIYTNNNIKRSKVYTIQ